MRILNGAAGALAIGCIGASVAAGCGGDSGGGGVSTGLQTTQLLSDMTLEQAEQACENLQAGVRRRFNQQTVVRAGCTLTAAAIASTPDSCISTRDACIDEANEAGSETMMSFDFEEVDFECGSGDSMAELGDCGDATVGELEACVNDTLDQLSALLTRYTCQDAAMVEMDDLEGIGEGLGEPAASCQVLDCAAALPFGD